MSDVVIDASALLALLNQEIEATQWSAAFADGYISAVNLSEVVAKLADVGMPEADIRSSLEPLGLAVVPFDTDQAYEAGLLRVQTKTLGLSLGDRACLALARRRRASVLATDRTWTRLKLGVDIQLVR